MSMNDVSRGQWLLLLRGSFLVLWAVVAGYVLLGSVSSHPLRRSRPQQMVLLAAIPEGWAFFTRNPREPRIEVFERNRAGNWRPVNWQNAALDLGLSRDGRVLHLALSVAVTRVPTASWHPCQERPVRCGSRIAPTLVRLDLSSPALRYLPRGRDLIVYIAPPVPWAWSRAQEPVAMPGRVARVLFTGAVGEQR